MEFFESEDWKNNNVSDSFVRSLIEIAKTGENYIEIDVKNGEFNIKNLLIEAKVLVDRHNFVVLAFVLNPKSFKKFIVPLPKVPFFKLYDSENNLSSENTIEDDKTIKYLLDKLDKTDSLLVKSILKRKVPKPLMSKGMIWGADIYVSEEVSEDEILAYCDFGTDSKAISLVKVVHKDV